MVRDGSRVHLLAMRPFDPHYITLFPIERPGSGKGFVEALMGRPRFMFRHKICVDHFPFGQGSLRSFVGLRMAPKCAYRNGWGWFLGPRYSESDLLSRPSSGNGSSPDDNLSG